MAGSEHAGFYQNRATRRELSFLFRTPGCETGNLLNRLGAVRIAQKKMAKAPGPAVPSPSDSSTGRKSGSVQRGSLLTPRRWIACFQYCARRSEDAGRVVIWDFFLAF